MIKSIEYEYGGKMMIANPTFFENEGGRQNGYDLFSRLLKDRIILLKFFFRYGRRNTYLKSTN